MDELNQLDLAFAVDTTGSMGPFINAARAQMTAMLRTVATAAATPVDLRVGLVEYRDHPPQDHSFVARPYAFSADLGAVQKHIAGLRPDGGGDEPEAVYDGLRVAAEGLTWRPHSQRLLVLVGDAPPHGLRRHGDGFPKGCPCGLTADGVTALLEDRGVTLYALALTATVRDCFARLARYTGGDVFEAARPDETIERLKEILAREFGELDFDRRVLDYCAAHPGWTVDALGEGLGKPRATLSASLSRLGRRGLLREAVARPAGAGVR